MQIKKERRGPMIPKIHKILYTTDLSPNSAYVFRYAINSADKHDAKLIILYVLEKPSDTAHAMLSSYLNEEQMKTLTQEKRSSVLERIEKRLKVFCEKELKVQPELAERVESIEVAEGFPAEVILSKADELNCDAIIMGTHGKGVIENTFLGSTSRRVLRGTRKPVFVIPLPKGEMDITFHDI
jgi:nucleotide-binding universal stress UspA family protein